MNLNAVKAVAPITKSGAANRCLHTFPALLIITLLLVLGQFVSMSASASVEDGDKAMKSERYRAAITQYEAYLKTNPNDGEAMIKAAQAYESAKWWGQAVQWWDKYLEKFPGGADAATAKRHSADCHRWLGANYYIIGGFYRMSVEELNKALALDPKLADAYVWLGTVYQNEGMYDEAIEVIDKGLKALPGDEILLMMRKDAENYRLNGGNAYVSHRKGIAMYESDDIDGALVMFRDAAKASPEFAAAHLWIARILFEKGDFAASIPEWQAAINIRPDNEHALFYLRLAQRDVAAGK